MKEEQPLVRLRAMEPEDLDLLYRIENDMQLWDVGSTNVPYSRYALHDYIANASGDIYADKQVRLIIEDLQSQVVGIVDVVNFDPAHRRAELGLIIEKPYRHRGYAQNAVIQITDYARRVLHLHQLAAYIDVTNEPCIQLFRKLGYHESARLKEWLFDGEEYHDAVVMQCVF